MYIGHFAPALAASAASPEAPRLGTLFVAAQLVDLAFFAFAIVGVEHMRVVPGITAMNPMDLYDMPFTHSLLATALWSGGFGLIVWRLCRSVAAGAWAALVVAAHWFLDLLVHRPDLTLAGHPPKLGLGLWDWPLVEMPLELGLTGLAFWFFLSRTRGPVGPPLIMLAVMLLFQAINWFGPQPDAYSVALPLTALVSYAILIALARWVGTTRRHERAAGLAMGSYRR
ncbi:MAG: hypothetical protein EOP59_14145 [Sphingomonadales bacterium]|nr:MAG: hypothetical protein EOP59_14145 [Sphingomonadales bacterium]